MFLKELHIFNFKNYSEQKIIFSENINCLVGNNGVGKTNILDAIYYLAFTKSYFTSIDTNNVKFGSDFFSINGKFVNHNLATDEINCSFKIGAKKIFKVNSKECDRLADHIGKISAVMISPYDKDIINDGSEIRRKFIDSIISQFDKSYLNYLIIYNKFINHRNALLKNKNKLDTTIIKIIDFKLCEPAQYIHNKRAEFIESFKAVLYKYFKIIGNSNEQPEINYNSNLFNNDFQMLLANTLKKDILFQHTTQGIHKDDFEFLINQKPVKRYGSQGQQKSFIIAIKLAQFEYIKQIKQTTPILLLDDIFDKLDNDRVNQIISLVSNDYFKQVFITDTQYERINNIFSNNNVSHRIFNVNFGAITPIK